MQLSLKTIDWTGLYELLLSKSRHSTRVQPSRGAWVVLVLLCRVSAPLLVFIQAQAHSELPAKKGWQNSS